MQLLRMELRGFKSFADKTVLTFDKGITAIVGPNGSGKSNISDAVRWVMGEQNIRQLRGQKSEDIIFSGTEKRKPHGVAEVSLYFDNSDHALDIDFTEVAVTRRYFRSGDSEFYINKRPCRLKDIHHLFADTGIGQDSMAVIGQNRVDRILNSKPEERRIIFEEVAGISRFKGRKEEGLRKISETERNLERIHDMMTILEERLEPMRQASDKLQRFRHLDGERQAYEGTLVLQELRNYERLLSKAENNRNMALQEREAAAKGVACSEGERQRLMAAMESESVAMRRLDEAAAAARNEWESLKSRAEAFEQRRQSLTENAKDLAAEGVVATEKRKKAEVRQQELAGELESKKKALTAARQGQHLAASLLGEAERGARQAAADLDKAVAAAASRQQKLFMIQRDIADLQRRLEENAATVGQLKADRQEQEALLQQARQGHTAAASALIESEKLAVRCRETMAEAATVRQQAVAAVEDAIRKERQRHNEAERLQQRIRVLAGMEEAHEGAGQAAQAVLAANQPWRNHVCGIVGELCAIPAAYAVAVDVALGGAARHVIVEHEEAARAAIRYLKQQHGGRTTFLPLNTVKSRKRTAEETAAAEEKGIAGFADALIRYDGKYAGVFSSLLGKTLIADSADTGSAVARKYGYRLRIVCLDGTQFHVGGSLTGGSNQKREGSLIGRRVLLHELRSQYDRFEEELLQLRHKAAVCQREETAASAAVAAQEKTLRQREQDLQQVRWQAETTRREADRLSVSLQEAIRKLEVLTELRSDIQAELVAANETLTRWQNEPEEGNEALREMHAAALAEAERCRETVTERQVAVAALQEQVRHAEIQLAQNGDWLQQLMEETEGNVKRRQDLAAKEEELTRLYGEVQAHLQKKEEELMQKERDKDAFYRSKEDNFRKNKELEEALQQLRDALEHWDHRINGQNILIEKYGGEIRRSEERLALQGLSRAEAMEKRREGSLQELQRTLRDLQQSIAALGQINPNADREYESAAEKHAFYQRQCDDLLEARRKLTAVVAEIDKAMAEQFSAAFKEISCHFQNVFSRLFGGGEAKILLTDSHQVLTAGIEFMIQPPGKKQQPLTLLSGGERALTVIALLLAFLAYHPAPFCLVDEVDAALDEANVERMARYLKNYSGNTQFIVITHRRQTMEAANTLQGVTMEEKGISRLLTVEVDTLLEKGR